jgi:addiction module HigA family antidote
VKLLPPIHPGEILREEYMRPLDLSINALARDLYVPVTRVSELVNERRSISADTALRLARYFDTTPDFWVNLQTKYDLEIASRESGKAIQDRVKPRHAA